MLSIFLGLLTIFVIAYMVIDGVWYYILTSKMILRKKRSLVGRTVASIIRKRGDSVKNNLDIEFTDAEKKEQDVVL